MIVGQLPDAQVAARLAGPGLGLRTGPFNVRIRSQVPAVAKGLRTLYAFHPVVAPDEFCDCTLEIAPPPGLRRWVRPQVQVRCDGQALFEPLPAEQAFALLEWTMNWWISGQAHQYLLLHAAVVARDDLAAVLPAPPGSGKSTLCAALTLRGWRLLSDEMAIVSIGRCALHGMVRPVSLKNRSLDVIREFEPRVVIGDAAHDTAKGTVAHLRPKPGDVAQMDEPARPAWIVFPRYEPGAEPLLTPRTEADSMMELGRNAFNYQILGLDGFKALIDLVSASQSFDFSYSRLDDAIAIFDSLKEPLR